MGINNEENMIIIDAPNGRKRAVYWGFSDFKMGVAIHCCDIDNYNPKKAVRKISKHDRHTLEIWAEKLKKGLL